MKYLISDVLLLVLLHTYLIFDSTGKKVVEGTSKSQVVKVNVSHLANGVYLIKINHNAAIKFQKMD